jgi:hypothetical protein
MCPSLLERGLDGADEILEGCQLEHLAVQEEGGRE